MWSIHWSLKVIKNAIQNKQETSVKRKPKETLDEFKDAKLVQVTQDNQKDQRTRRKRKGEE